MGLTAQSFLNCLKNIPPNAPLLHLNLPPLPRPLSSQELPPGLTPFGEGASVLSQGSQSTQLQKNLGGFLVHLHCQTLTL